MALDERAIAQVLEQVRRGLRRVEHGQVQVTVANTRYYVRTLLQTQDEETE